MKNLSLTALADFIRVPKIEQAQPYSQDYQTCIAQVKADLQKNARPEVLNLPNNLHDYDGIYLDYPNYWGTMPMAVYIFLERYDFFGKSIIAFQGKRLYIRPFNILILLQGCRKTRHPCLIAITFLRVKSAHLF